VADVRLVRFPIFYQSFSIPALGYIKIIVGNFYARLYIVSSNLFGKDMILQKIEISSDFKRM